MTSGDTTGRKVFLHSAERPDETQEKRLNAFLCKRYGEGAELVWVEDHTLETASVWNPGTMCTTGARRAGWNSWPTA